MMLSCLPLFLGIRAQEHLGVGFINLELFCLVTRLGKLCIIELLLHKQIRILRLQALDSWQFFQRQIVKRFLRRLVDEDVALMRIVIFLGIPGLAIGSVDISGLNALDWNLASVKYYITKLKEKNYLKRQGSSQKGKWVILTKRD